MSEKPCGAYFFAFFENFFVPILTSGGLAAVSSSAFAALYSAFGKYDVVHIHAEGPAFFAWLPKMFGKRVVVTVHGIDWQREKWQSGLGSNGVREFAKVREDTAKKNSLFTELFIINLISTTISLIAYIFVLILNNGFNGEGALYICCGLAIFFNYLNIDWIYQGLEEYGYITGRRVD